MKSIITLAAVSVLSLSVSGASQPAFARDGAIAAGVIGGLAAGAIIGSQQRNYYSGPSYVDQPAYVVEPQYRACHTERQEVVDAYGNVRMRRVRVCD